MIQSEQFYRTLFWSAVNVVLRQDGVMDMLQTFVKISLVTWDWPVREVWAVRGPECDWRLESGRAQHQLPAGWATAKVTSTALNVGAQLSQTPTPPPPPVSHSQGTGGETRRRLSCLSSPWGPLTAPPAGRCLVRETELRWPSADVRQPVLCPYNTLTMFTMMQPSDIDSLETRDGWETTQTQNRM